MKYYLAYLILLLLSSCASIDLPPGGDKDILAPVILESTPSSEQTLFTGNTIRIVFDEYFSLNNFNTNLLVSPPLNVPPKTKIKGKTLYLNLQEELLPNVTYQFYFGEGIVDLNEGNKTKDLRLVFSTGPSLDTNVVSGYTLDAFTKETLGDIKLLLYKEYQDSQLLNGQPYYITKSDKNGSFTFNNISDKDFFLYAIDDQNNNNKLDIDESFAVCDTIINHKSKAPSLMLSKQIQTKTLQLSRLEQPIIGQYKCVFNQPLKLSNVLLKSTSLQPSSKTGKVLWHFGKTSDTLFFYDTNKQTNDSIYTLIHNKDTIDINLKNAKTNPIEFISKIDIPQITPTLPITINVNYAVEKTNSTLIRLTDLTDSAVIAIDSITIDQLNKIKIASEIKEGHNYEFVFYKGSVTYINGKTNISDTIKQQVIQKTETGEIELKVLFSSDSSPRKTIILVIEGKNNRLDNIVCTSDTLITKTFLKPDKYSVYAFEDLDENDEWTPANYLKKIEPEPIWRLKSPIDVRKNWSNKNIELKIN